MMMAHPHSQNRATFKFFAEYIEIRGQSLFKVDMILNGFLAIWIFYGHPIEYLILNFSADSIAIFTASSALIAE